MPTTGMGAFWRLCGNWATRSDQRDPHWSWFARHYRSVHEYEPRLSVDFDGSGGLLGSPQHRPNSGRIWGLRTGCPEVGRETRLVHRRFVLDELFQLLLNPFDADASIRC